MRMVRVPAARPHCVSVGWSPIIQESESVRLKSSQACNSIPGEGLRHPQTRE